MRLPTLYSFTLWWTNCTVTARGVYCLCSDCDSEWIVWILIDLSGFRLKDRGIIACFRNILAFCLCVARDNINFIHKYMGSIIFSVETPCTTCTVTAWGINCPIFDCIGICIDLFGFLLWFRLIYLDSDWWTMGPPVNNIGGANQHTKSKIWV